jgi:hypothetical protein
MCAYVAYFRPIVGLVLDIVADAGQKAADVNILVKVTDAGHNCRCQSSGSRNRCSNLGHSCHSSAI